MKLEDYLGKREDYEIREEYLVRNREDLKYKIGDVVQLIPVEKLMACSMISDGRLLGDVLSIEFLEDGAFTCPIQLYSAPRIITNIGHQGGPDSYYYIVEELEHEDASSWVDEWMIQPKVTNIQKMLKFARMYNDKP